MTAAGSTCHSAMVSISGIVVHGKGFGRFMGIPTANIDTECDVSALDEGVYCSRISIGDVVHYGTVNIGHRPTVDNIEKITIEVNILDFNQDIYGKSVVLDVYRLIRPTQRFDSLSSLIMQIRSDSLSTLSFFGVGLEKRGVCFDLPEDAVDFDGARVCFDDKGIGLMFMMLVNPSCSFTCDQIYQAVWHENVCKETPERVALLVSNVNGKLIFQGVDCNIELSNGKYRLNN